MIKAQLLTLQQFIDGPHRQYGVGGVRNPESVHRRLTQNFSQFSFAPVYEVSAVDPYICGDLAFTQTEVPFPLKVGDRFIYCEASNSYLKGDFRELCAREVEKWKVEQLSAGKSRARLTEI